MGLGTLEVSSLDVGCEDVVVVGWGRRPPGGLRSCLVRAEP